MTSNEKVAALRTELTGPPQPGEDPRQGMLRTAIMFLGPMLEAVIPQDPVELDDAIGWCAEQLLELRSDPVEAQA
jgi:hypothetical protein